MRKIPTIAMALALAASTPGCDGSSSPAGPDYDPGFEPAEFVAAVTNPFFPLVPGTRWVYQGESEDGIERVEVEVLAEKRNVAGVSATVVHDRVYVDDELVEDTFDWYGQDSEGNVWYLGEHSEEIEDGEVVSTEGSWETGVDGALPGILMWADPAAHVGEEYRQEFYEGEAEDWGKVAGTGRSVSVEFGDFEGCVETEEWNALEPGTREAKWYCPQVGFVLEVVTQGGEERVELIETGP